MRADADKDEEGLMMVARASSRGLWLGGCTGLMPVARASACGSWLGGCVNDIMPGDGVDTDGASEVGGGHNGLMGTQKSPIAGRARLEVTGMCILIMRLCARFGGMNHMADGAGEVEVGTLMVMGSPGKMSDLVPIGYQGG